MSSTVDDDVRSDPSPTKAAELASLYEILGGLVSRKILKKNSGNFLGLVKHDFMPGFHMDDKSFEDPKCLEFGRRGMTIVRDEQDKVCIAAVMALPKFYNDGDKLSFDAVAAANSSSSSSSSSSTQTAPGRGPQLAYSAYLNKVNGECCHLAAFEYQKQVYLIMGSKNAHFFVRVGHEEEDTEAYAKEPRYGYAIEFSKVILADIQSNKKKIVEHLVQTGETWTGEVCMKGHMHIVNYFDGAMERKDFIIWFAVTLPGSLKKGYVSRLPSDAVDLFKTHGLMTVPYLHIGATDEERAKIKEKVMLETNSEGAVRYDVYEIDGDGEDGNVEKTEEKDDNGNGSIGTVDGTDTAPEGRGAAGPKNPLKRHVVLLMAKEKARQYVIERMTREKLKLKKPMQDLLKRFEQANATQFKEMKMTEEEVHREVGFFEWALKTIIDDEAWKNLSNKWPLYRHQFMNEKEEYPERIKAYVDLALKQTENNNSTVLREQKECAK